MAHKSKWAKMCKNQKGQECYNCLRKVCIKEEKNQILVTCNYHSESRTLTFSRRVKPYCGAWKAT